MLANPSFIINRPQAIQHNAIQGKTVMHLEENKAFDMLGVITKKDRDQMEHKRHTHLNINANISQNALAINEGKVSQHNLDLIKNMFKPGENRVAGSSEYPHSGNNWDVASFMRSVSGITDNN